MTSKRHTPRQQDKQAKDPQPNGHKKPDEHPNMDTSGGRSHDHPVSDSEDESKHSWYHTVNWWKCLEGAGIFFAIGYAIVSFLQWRDLRHNFMVDQRAWVTATNAAFGSSGAGEFPTVVANFQNSGKSPALKTAIRANVMFGNGTILHAPMPMSPSNDAGGVDSGLDLIRVSGQVV